MEGIIFGKDNGSRLAARGSNSRWPALTRELASDIGGYQVGAPAERRGAVSPLFTPS
jgi:hypothetical protein